MRPTIHVDFNEFNEAGHLMVSNDDILSLPPSSGLLLVDDEGNAMSGRLVGRRGRLATVEVDWSTWNPMEDQAVEWETDSDADYVRVSFRMTTTFGHPTSTGAGQLVHAG